MNRFNAYTLLKCAARLHDAGAATTLTALERMLTRSEKARATRLVMISPARAAESRPVLHKALPVCAKKRSESLQDRDLTSTTKSIWMTDMTPHCFAGIGRLIHSATVRSPSQCLQTALPGLLPARRHAGSSFASLLTLFSTPEVAWDLP